MHLFLLFLLINGLISSASCASNTMQFELIHRHAADKSLASKPQHERVQDLLHQDHHRTRMISRRAGKRRKDLEFRGRRPSSASLPMHSGAYSGTGQYFVNFHIGTPAQKFLLVVDTGSDLTWMNCRHHCRDCHDGTLRRRVFNTDKSSSFKKISCSSRICPHLPFALVDCPTPMSPCQYDYRYEDGSQAHGIFAKETVVVSLGNRKRKDLHNVVIGCSSVHSGDSFVAADGVLGLGFSNSSFALKAKEMFGGKFTYCLVDHLSPKNMSSFLTFGQTANRYIGSATMLYTDLLLNVMTGFYAVNIKGVSIDGVILNIPPEVWDEAREGGVIIDTGTSLTFLAEPAYTAIMGTLTSRLRPLVTPADMPPFEFCFSSDGFQEAMVPKLQIHFEGTARMEPPVKSYVIDVATGVKCLGFIRNGWPDVSIIGNIMQQNFIWEYDFVNGRLGFAPSTCTVDYQRREVV